MYLRLCCMLFYLSLQRLNELSNFFLQMKKLSLSEVKDTAKASGEDESSDLSSITNQTW